MLAAGVLAACSVSPEPEPVQFAAVHTELFERGGALTDAWADFDGDGDPDRFVGFNDALSRLYRNDRLAGFQDVAGDLGLTVSRPVRSAAWGDFDTDGDPDLLLGLAGEGPALRLFRNDDGLALVDVADSVGLGELRGSTRQASWIDVDEDGDLDLFLALRDRENALFRNDGDAGFRNVAEELGLDDAGPSVGAAWFDLGDGGLDLVVANMDGHPNALLARQGSGFVSRADPVLAGGGRPVGDPASGSVRPCVVDHDNDGTFEISFANYGPNGLLRSDGVDGWRDVSADLGLAVDSRDDACAWADFDHDGLQDLFVNGTLTGGVHYRDWLYRRQAGSPRFVDATPPQILERGSDHGVTWVDFDLDGDLDLALNGVGEEGSHALLQNLLRPEFAWHSLRIRVLDEHGAATHPGAEVRAYSAGTRRLRGTRLVDTGSGYNGQSDLPVHFGLPGGQPVDLEVTVFGQGLRHTALIPGVDPAQHQGRILEVRIDRSGRVH